MAQNETSSAAGNWFADILKTPALRALARRVEQGGALTFCGVAASAQPLVAALLRHLCPRQPIVVVVDNLKTQESFQQDLETWSQIAGGSRLAGAPDSPVGTLPASRYAVLFYPAWGILPHEGKLPHADVISERLETLVALGGISNGNSSLGDGIGGEPPAPPLIVTFVVALLQQTFAPDDLQRRARHLKRGD